MASIIGWLSTLSIMVSPSHNRGEKVGRNFGQNGRPIKRPVT
jgi:hypothetical protein